YLLVMVVPFLVGVLVDAQHLPHGRCQAGDRHPSSTRPGTTSRPFFGDISDHVLRVMVPGFLVVVELALFRAFKKSGWM
ncbi:MAG: hypothetical protein ACYDDU_20840, partial [Dermatophilaceae bacterium]